MTFSRWLAAAALGLFPLTLHAAVRISVLPTSAWPATGQSVRFSAVLAGTADTAVTWQVDDVTGGSAATGTISASGLYTAPTTIPPGGVARIKAIAHADATKLARALVNVGAPTVRLSVAPTSVAVEPGLTQTFSATAINTANQAVSWRVNGTNGGSVAFGTISTSGVYTAPATRPVPGIVVVSAVSKADPAAMAIARVVLAPPANRHVSTIGSDLNDGSAGAPWRTIQRAASLAVAGDIVEVAGGVYHETVNVAHSGSAAGGYIIFQSAPGQTAIVDGSGLDIPNNESGLFTLESRSYVVVSGFELRNFTTALTTQAPVGIYIDGKGSHVQLIANRVHDISTTAPGSTCSDNALGIAVYGNQLSAPISALTIRGNEVDHNTLGCSESLSVGGNVTGFNIVDNLVHDNNNIGIDATGGYGLVADDTLDKARNGNILRNVVANITSFYNPAYGAHYGAGGIYVDGGSDIVISRNVVRGADLGMELAAEQPGHNTARVTANDNLFIRSTNPGISIGGYAAGRGGTQDCVIANNTLFANDVRNSGSGELQIQFNASGNVFKNNIVSAGPQALMVNSFTTSTPDPADLDHNLWFAAAGAANTDWTWQQVRYRGFDAYRAATGKDAGSTFADPQFPNVAVPLLKVKATSPAVNMGADLGAGAQGAKDFAGLARVLGAGIDIGAYEQP